MVIAVAGPEAAERAFPDGDPGDQADTRDIFAIGWQLVGRLGCASDMFKEIDQATARARQLIADHWRDIEALAYLLLQWHDATMRIVPVESVEALDRLAAGEDAGKAGEVEVFEGAKA